MSLWRKYTAWVSRDMAETYPMMIGYSFTIWILPLCLNFIFAWVHVIEPVRLSVLALTAIASLVLFSAVVRSAAKEAKQRWNAALHTKDRG